MIRFVCLVFLASALSACSKDDDGQVFQPVPDITAFQNWEADAEKADQATQELAVLSEDSEKPGTVPSFFTGQALTTRDQRDNIDSGYIYPLYFATKTRDFPSRQWEDGYTISKSNPSDDFERRRIDGIRAEFFDYYDEGTAISLFYGLKRYGLIDIRHYSFKPQPPLIAETCFTIRYESENRGTINFCYDGHRFLKTANNTFPKARYSNQTGSRDNVEAFKLFALSIAAYEVMFDNPDNRALRDHFITKDRLSVQMHEANEAFNGIFDYVVEDQAYLNGRQ